MNQDPKEKVPIRKSSGWLALVAILALGFSAAAWHEVHQNMDAGEQDRAMLEQLNEVARLHVLLSQIGNGRLAAVRHQLQIKMAEDRAAVQPLVASAGPDAAVYARTVLATIDRYQREHSDYYLVTWPSLAPEKVKVASSIRQVIASGVVPH